jgi:hypothetical protein
VTVVRASAAAQTPGTILGVEEHPMTEHPSPKLRALLSPDSVALDGSGDAALSEAEPAELAELWASQRPERPAEPTHEFWDEVYAPPSVRGTEGSCSRSDGYVLAGQIVELYERLGSALPDELVVDAARYAYPMAVVWAYAQHAGQRSADEVYEAIIRLAPLAFEQSGRSECRVVAYARLVAAHPGLYERLTTSGAELHREQYELAAAAAGDIYYHHGNWCVCGLARCGSCNVIEPPEGCRNLGCRLGGERAKAESDAAHPEGYALSECVAAEHPDPCAGAVGFHAGELLPGGRVLGGVHYTREGIWCERHLSNLLACAAADEPGACAGDALHEREGSQVCTTHRQPPVRAAS